MSSGRHTAARKERGGGGERRGRPFKKGHDPWRAPGKPFKPGMNSHTGAVVRRGPDLIPRRQIVRTILLRALVMPDYRMPDGRKAEPGAKGGRWVPGGR